jgi:septum formation protein
VAELSGARDAPGFRAIALQPRPPVAVSRPVKKLSTQMHNMKTNSQAPVVLGSRSPQRRELLGSMVGAKSLKIMPPLSSAEADFHDVHDDAGFESRLMEVVLGKYDDVRQQTMACRKDSDFTDQIRPYIVAADTIVIATNDQGQKRVLGQPAPENWQAEVRDWLKHWLAGRTHEVWTGTIVSGGDEQRSFIVKSTVTFCPMSDAMIEWYISTSESLGKAGGYAIQAHAAAFVSQFSGSLTTIIGLPLLEVVGALQDLGWKFPDSASRD